MTGGAIAALGGRASDRIISRVIDVFISFPPLVLALVLVSVMGPSSLTVASAIGWTWWPAEARIIRSLLHRARRRDFVDAALLSGVHPLRVLARHIWPQIAPVIAIRLSLELGAVILALSTLSFLGLGISLLLMLGAGLVYWIRA